MILIALGLSRAGGCRKPPPPPAEPIRVLATTYAMADVVREVGGERVRLEWWIESGNALAELVESPERRNQLNTVDLIVTRGQADPWTLAGSGNAYLDRRILRLDGLLAARDLDPTHYIWLDPQVARDLADEAATRLTTLEPRSEKFFKSNAADFNRRIAAMMERTSSTINRAGGGAFVTLDRGFYPLARRFGLDDVKVPMVSLDEPSAFNVRALRTTAADAGSGVIFGSTETPIALRRDWEGRLGIPVLPLDPLGTSVPTGRSTYLSLLAYNLEQLERGIGLSKARAPAGPTPLGTVLNSGAPEPPPTDAAGEPPPSTAPSATARSSPGGTTPVAPPTRYEERVRIKLPPPPTRPAAPSPFKPIPAR